ncbi:MAG TPA: phosphatase PAP2 family protein [Caulobacteraceae bacterium]|jgi:undecaprenyl-diphosphatase|nr:phosphatase PAP2 family protein [Caulobacteraceae bacterium]
MPAPSPAFDITTTASGWFALVRGLGARLLLTAVAVGSGLFAFADLTGEVREGETSAFDRTVLLAFRRAGDLGVPVGPHWMQETARDVTALGGFTVLTVVTVLATALLLMHGRRLQAAIFAGTVVASQLLVDGLKLLLARARPDLVPHHDLVYSNSFPSGHAMLTPVVFLTLAAIVSAGEPRRSVRTLLVGAAAALVLAVGVSRVYLGVHWPTDVAAGWLLGAAIAAAASFALHRAAPAKVVKPDAPGTP